MIVIRLLIYKICITNTVLDLHILIQPAKKISRRSESSSIAIHLGCIAALSDQLVATLSKTSLHHLHHLVHLTIMLLQDLSREDYYLKLCQTVYQGQLDRVPVSVSE